MLCLLYTEVLIFIANHVQYIQLFSHIQFYICGCFLNPCYGNISAASQHLILLSWHRQCLNRKVQTQ